ncbi:MAG: cytidine deaminase [Mycoplasmataceae bacterium]|jgi:cytidine deaminase|nr:cytidine deaminase [Mycoplasmataceae bacterium]
MHENNFQKLAKLIKRAYAPYSHFKVAALVETDKGIFVGVNVENASFSLSLCAERVAITNAITNGAKKFKSLYLLSSKLQMDVTPCGACRQVIFEFCPRHMPIYVYNKIGKVKKYLVSQLLPQGFKLKK